LEDASAGSGSLVLFEGPAGIGKTSLLLAARERARGAGMLVLHGRGGELERDDPFGLARQCLEPAVRELEERERERLLTGAAALAAPVVLDVPRAVPGLTPGGVLHGLYWMVSGLSSGRPVLLVVDDVQWADEASLRFLSYLVRRID
jgi:predicted ATPase